MTLHEADMTHRTRNNPESTPVSRLTAALTDPDRLFTPAEVAWLMSVAGRWGREIVAAEQAADPLSWRAGYLAGYRKRVAEENGDYPPPPIFAFGEWQTGAERQAARERAESDRTQRYGGGPVEVWPATRADHVPPGDISVRVVRTGSGHVWRDA